MAIQLIADLYGCSQVIDDEKAYTEKKGYIVFDDVSLTYGAGAESALKHVSFSVEKGETVGIIGGTGSGKTSLISLLPHFLQTERTSPS